jgi:uncharacterized membrane protein YdjX (TVP38/TMEM64 family)
MKSRIYRLIPIAILSFLLFITILVVCWYGCWSLEDLQKHATTINDFVENYYVFSVLIFGLLYVIDNVFMLPTANALSIAAGYFFGIIPATIYTLFAAAIGSSISFFLARDLLKKYVQNTFEPEIRIFNHDMRSYGIYYLLLVRLIPYVPYALTNMFAGLTKVPFFTFLWTTVVGLIPLTVMHVLAGHQFKSIESVYDIFSWPMVLILAALIAILITTLVIKKYQKHRHD